jgi:hypothetical protein
VQCHDVVPNVSLTRHDVSHCFVEEVKIVMFINQIEYDSVGILIQNHSIVFIHFYCVYLRLKP